MKTELFSVFDAAAKRYLDPFCGPTLEFGIRGFKEACQQEAHQFTKFPEDYSLWHIATWDGELGEMHEMKAHKIAMASSFVQTHRDGEQIESQVINGETVTEQEQVRLEGRS